MTDMIHSSDRLIPLTYAESRARFLAAAGAVESHPLDLLGPDGGELAIDVALVGDPGASTVAVIGSGTHGVEGPAGSMLQTDLLERLADGRAALPSGLRLVLIHAINPWGFAWLRRQNESNVDLNRNWVDFAAAIEPNEAYAEVHGLLCPADSEVPDGDTFVASLSTLSATKGLPWVREAVSSGQYSHADGLYYGGARHEASTRIVEKILQTHVAGASEALTLDLHTGHGKWGTYTVLSRALLGSDADRWVRSTFGDAAVETTVANPDATLAAKNGQLLLGIVAELGIPRVHSVTFELGTRSETRMIVAEHLEHWVHMHGDRDHPDHAAIVWDHRCCSIPDDREWERSALDHGRTVLDQALTALV